MNLEISNFKQPFDHIKVFSNDILVYEHVNTNIINVDIVTPTKIRVEFFPFKLTPIVRVDNFMLNYWLANILLYDHCLEIDIADNFFQNYKDKDIQGRLDHIPKDQKNEHYFDKYIGLNNLYPDLINEIKQLLDL